MWHVPFGQEVNCRRVSSFSFFILCAWRFGVKPESPECSGCLASSSHKPSWLELCRTMPGNIISPLTCWALILRFESTFYNPFVHTHCVLCSKKVINNSRSFQLIRQKQSLKMEFTFMDCFLMELDGTKKGNNKLNCRTRAITTKLKAELHSKTQ